MADITKNYIQAHASAVLGKALGDQQGEALADTVKVLLGATEDLATRVTLDWEPSLFLKAVRKTAED